MYTLASGQSRMEFGAQYEGPFTRFAARSSVAERIELCLFDGAGLGREDRVTLARDAEHKDRFACVLEGIAPGQRYGFRVHGPYAPREGLRCNPHKLLLDPYALEIAGTLTWAPEVFGGSPEDPERADTRDSAPFVPRSVVVDPRFDWGDDAPIRRAWEDTFIYELHVKSWSAQWPRIPEAMRGTYAALAHPASLEHFHSLGVTALELMPIHAFASERALQARGLSNHWGYNTLGFFAPHAAYATSQAGGELLELKQTIRALHDAGIEVLLDVVYNHTAETGHEGPTLSLRGFDNAAYYALAAHDRSQYVDYTGCGNTLRASHPFAQDLILDSLRYWASELHVDGFRFDLASALLREGERVDMRAALLERIHADPVLRDLKLIAEPWDVGPHGYQVGGFPAPWSEWNGCFRDDVRACWRGDGDAPGKLAMRLTGSADLYEHSRRTPRASINFVTSHDGFTLRDLVSYEHKHNDDNGEDNRDGERDNRSFNCGVEGETADPHVLWLRARQQRNMLATLFLSAGTPMLTAGDELGRTQRGNNNAYCQDNALSWLDWEHVDETLLAFVQRLSALRSAHAVLRPRAFGDVRARAFRADGLPMQPQDWSSHDGRTRAFALLLESASPAPTHAATDLCVLINPTPHAQRFSLPDCRWLGFRHVLDTAEPARAPHRDALVPNAALHVTGHALRVLERLR